MTAAYTRLDVYRDGPVGWIVFDRPDVANAMDAVMFDELERAWQELDADPDVRAIVNTGNGDAFQTGLDVRALAGDREGLREHARRTRDAQLRFTAWHLQIWKPVIAAVNGVCAGGGLHFVADADIRIAADTATFVDPHVSIGQAVAYETIALAVQSPMEAILRMALTGRHERMTAARAYQLGIVGELTEPAALRTRAQALGETIARNSPTAMALSKQALWGAFERGLTDACRAGGQRLLAMWGHPDQEEGPRAFAERRAPDWRPLDRRLARSGETQFGAQA
jgi:enoyl-CoA hydratase/carnithine racemase